MPIKGLTDKQEARFPRIGILRKGAPKPDDKHIGKDLKYFRFVTDDQAAAADFMTEFGPNPAQITVFLPFATTDENFEAWQEEWGAGSLKHRCDGETTVLWQDGDGAYQHTPKPCPGNCKPTGRLMVIIPKLRRLAYVQVLTTSKWDIIELTANIKAAEETARMMGRTLVGIPFLLTRVPRKISTPPRGGQKTRTRIEKWLLHIEPAPEWVAAQIEAAKQAAMPMLQAPQVAPDGLTYPNGDDEEADIETTATEYTEPEPEQEEAPGPRLYGRTDFIARIRELEAENNALGNGGINFDQAILDEASPDDLKRIGKDLAALVAQRKAELQAEQAKQMEQESMAFV